MQLRNNTVTPILILTTQTLKNVWKKLGSETKVYLGLIVNDNEIFRTAMSTCQFRSLLFSKLDIFFQQLASNKNGSSYQLAKMKLIKYASAMLLLGPLCGTNNMALV